MSFEPRPPLNSSYFLTFFPAKNNMEWKPQTFKTLPKMISTRKPSYNVSSIQSQNSTAIKNYVIPALFNISASRQIPNTFSPPLENLPMIHVSSALYAFLGIFSILIIAIIFAIIYFKISIGKSVLEDQSVDKRTCKPARPCRPHIV